MAKKKPSPKHGSTPKDSIQESQSVSQPDGTAARDPRGETQAQPSSRNRENPHVETETPENRTGQIEPSAPTESTEGGHVTQHLIGSGPSTMDTSGEVGHPSGKGTLEVNERQVSTQPGKKGTSEGSAEPKSTKAPEPSTEDEAA